MLFYTFVLIKRAKQITKQINTITCFKNIQRKYFFRLKKLPLKAKIWFTIYFVNGNKTIQNLTFRDILLNFIEHTLNFEDKADVAWHLYKAYSFSVL